MKSQDDPIGKWRSDNAVRSLTAEAAADIAKKIASKETQKTHEEVVVDKADLVVSECTQAFIRMHNLKITPMTFAEAVDLVYKLHRDQFIQWSKDDLLVLASFQNALISVTRLQDELI